MIRKLKKTAKNAKYFQMNATQILDMTTFSKLPIGRVETMSLFRKIGWYLSEWIYINYQSYLMSRSKTSPSHRHVQESLI